MVFRVSIFLFKSFDTISHKFTLNYSQNYKHYYSNYNIRIEITLTIVNSLVKPWFLSLGPSTSKVNKPTNAIIIIVKLSNIFLIIPTNLDKTTPC